MQCALRHDSGKITRLWSSPCCVCEVEWFGSVTFLAIASRHSSGYSQAPSCSPSTAGNSRTFSTGSSLRLTTSWSSRPVFQTGTGWCTRLSAPRRSRWVWCWSLRRCGAARIAASSASWKGSPKGFAGRSTSATTTTGSHSRTATSRRSRTCASGTSRASWSTASRHCTSPCTRPIGRSARSC